MERSNLKKNETWAAWFKSGTRAPGIRTLGPWDHPQSLKVGPQDPIQILQVGPS